MEKYKIKNCENNKKSGMLYSWVIFIYKFG